MASLKGEGKMGEGGEGGWGVNWCDFRGRRWNWMGRASGNGGKEGGRGAK